MNTIIKSFYARLQKSIIATLAGMMFFVTAGCGNKESAPPEEEEEDILCYFYDEKGEKIFLTLSTKYAFLSVREPVVPNDIFNGRLRRRQIFQIIIDRVFLLKNITDTVRY